MKLAPYALLVLTAVLGITLADPKPMPNPEPLLDALLGGGGGGGLLGGLLGGGGGGGGLLGGLLGGGGGGGGLLGGLLGGGGSGGGGLLSSLLGPQGLVGGLLGTVTGLVTQLVGTLAGLLDSLLGGVLGGLLGGVLESGAGGNVHTDPRQGGCQATSIANLIQGVLDVLRVKIQPCTSSTECQGIGVGVCGVLPGLDHLGQICRLSS